MFWRFGGYPTVSAIDAILEKPNFTLEDLLSESDLIQELKQHNQGLHEYLREDAVLQKLLHYVTAPKLEPVVAEDVDAERQEKDDASDNNSRAAAIATKEQDDQAETKRNKFAYVAAEILSSDSRLISACLLENTELLREFWQFLKTPAPLDPLQSSYFTKVNEALLDKYTEEMLQFFKTIEGIVPAMLNHVDSPMVMDLLLKIISLEKQVGGEGIVDWLYSQDLMPILLSFLSEEHSWGTQTSAGDFLKAIITISANASQNEQSCIGPNQLTRQLVSHDCVEKLIADMLHGGNPLTVGVGIVIEVIRKNNSDYDPEVSDINSTTPSSKDPIYLGTLLRLFAKHVPDFMALILSPNHTVGGGDGPISIKRKELDAAFGGKIEPLGFDRFKTCELMAELLHCSNMGLLNEEGGDDFVNARDQERERLRLEGKLYPQTESNDDVTMKSVSSGRYDSQSPDSTRRLEVQNATDDDGFEEVKAEVEFDERPDLEDYESASAIKPTPLSFMDKDHDEFVDEPLSSPRLNPLDEGASGRDPSLMVLPLSPTKELGQDMGDLHVMEKPKSASTEAAVTDSKSLKSLESLTTALEVGESSLMDVDDSTGSVDFAEIESKDKPAPLFSKNQDGGSSKEPDGSSNDDANHTPTTSDDATDQSRDSTYHETTHNSIMVKHEGDVAPEPEPPVVGDYLKMQFVEHHVVPTIIDFFFRFPWNNFLHNVVYDVVQQVFNGPMERGYNRTLAIDLFETGDITGRIVMGQQKSDHAQIRNRMRLGYMGHLTLIAEEVVKFTERHPPELLSESVLARVMDAEWHTYVEITLSETRERDNAILGGVRPDMASPERAGAAGGMSSLGGSGSLFDNPSSSALADAGLNGTAVDELEMGSSDMTVGSGVGSGSQFGGSSDEEEEEDLEEELEDGMHHPGQDGSRHDPESVFGNGDDEDEQDHFQGVSKERNDTAEVGIPRFPHLTPSHNFPTASGDSFSCEDSNTPSPPQAPNLDTFDDEDIDYDLLEQLDKENPLFPEGS